mmetsp:Transcript_9260/g.27123  ORF Transcript_9260/g.27123 Transcript_9260/m.27123 type:complete len:267 (-) Transcript_9260:1335-2135(-)
MIASSSRRSNCRSHPSSASASAPASAPPSSRSTSSRAACSAASLSSSSVGRSGGGGGACGCGCGGGASSNFAAAASMLPPVARKASSAAETSAPMETSDARAVGSTGAVNSAMAASASLRWRFSASNRADSDARLAPLRTRLSDSASIKEPSAATSPAMAAGRARFAANRPARSVSSFAARIELPSALRKAPRAARGEWPSSCSGRIAASECSKATSIASASRMRSAACWPRARAATHSRTSSRASGTNAAGTFRPRLAASTPRLS